MNNGKMCFHTNDCRKCGSYEKLKFWEEGTTGAYLCEICWDKAILEWEEEPSEFCIGNFIYEKESGK